MKSPLRILHLEDDPKDVELIEAMLTGEGLASDIHRVDTRKSYISALEQGGFDLILADYWLGSFDGLSALRMAGEKCPEIPFILVSGTLGEEVAVESLKAGATDYILKDRLFRLVPCVKRALHEAELMRERKQAEERIRALDAIDTAISSTLDLSTVLDILLEKIEVFLPFATATTVRLFRRETGELESLACRGLDKEKWRSQQHTSPSGRAQRIVETRTPLVVRNILSDTQTYNPEIFRERGLISYLGVPLIAKDEVLGVLGLYTSQEHDFSAQEIEFLNTLAGQAAIAIHNAQLYEEMVRSNKVKDEFLSVMSHELRTPLTVLTGYVGLLKDGVLGKMNPDQEKTCGKILRRTEDLVSIVDSILFTTSLETKSVKLERHSVDLIHLLSELRSAYDASLEKELSLIWNYPAELPPLSTDGTKLKHALQNLINNAIKFTDKGRVTVSARIISAPNPHFVEFKVADTGIGIAKDHLAHIFDKFRQVDSSETRLYGGVGLGLYIAKKFTEMLGGNIEVESEPGKGSIFTVRIPI